MIKINENKYVENSIVVNSLSGIMEKRDAEKVVEQLEKYQNTDPRHNENEIDLENKTGKELFLDKFKILYFNCSFTLKEAIKEANRKVNLTEREIREILDIIVNVTI